MQTRSCALLLSQFLLSTTYFDRSFIIVVDRQFIDVNIDSGAFTVAEGPRDAESWFWAETYYIRILNVSLFILTLMPLTVRRQCRWHCWGTLQRLFPNQNALVAVIKGMRAIKLCANKILQFLSGGAGLHRLTCIMAVKRWLLLTLMFLLSAISFHSAF